MVIGKDSDDGLKLARVYWIGLGRPSKFDTKGVMDKWAPRMETLMRKAGMAYEDFKWYLIWATRSRDPDGANYGNDYSAKFLRVAQDPMQSLEKNFPRMFFEIYAESAKKLPYLKDKVQQERDMMLRDYVPPTKPWSWHEAYCGSMKNPPAWKREAARYFTALDERFPMLDPAPGEDWEDFVDRTLMPLSDNREWQCSKCTYNPSRTGVRTARPVILVDGKWVCAEDENMVEQPVWYGMEERLNWCGDCFDELLADRDEDRIIHAQDNSPLTHLDLVFGWDDIHSLRFLKFQLPRPKY